MRTKLLQTDSYKTINMAVFIVLEKNRDCFPLPFIKCFTSVFQVVFCEIWQEFQELSVEIIVSGDG